MRTTDDPHCWHAILSSFRAKTWNGTAYCTDCVCELAPGDLVQHVWWWRSLTPPRGAHAEQFCSRCRREALPVKAYDAVRDTVVVTGRLDEDLQLEGLSLDVLSPPVEVAPSRSRARMKGDIP